MDARIDGCITQQIKCSQFRALKSLIDNKWLLDNWKEVSVLVDIHHTD